MPADRERPWPERLGTSPLAPRLPCRPGSPTTARASTRDTFRLAAPGRPPPPFEIFIGRAGAFALHLFMTSPPAALWGRLDDRSRRLAERRRPPGPPHR